MQFNKQLIDLGISSEDFGQKLQLVNDAQKSRSPWLQKTQLQEVKLLIKSNIPPVTVYIDSQSIHVKFVLPQKQEWWIDGQFYIDKRDQMEILALKFLVFLQIGKIEFSEQEYIPLLKLAYVLNCQVLFERLIKKPIESQMGRSFSLDCLIIIYKHPIFQTEEGQNFAETMAISNEDNIVKHHQWEQVNLGAKKILVETALKNMEPKLFEIFLNKYKSLNKIDLLNQFVAFTDRYSNPNFNVFITIYISTIHDLINEEFINKYRNVLPNTLYFKLQEIVNSKFEKKSFHVTRTFVCDLVQKSFVASCGHKICLNCFFEYLIYKSQNIKQQNDPIQVRCFSRLLDINNCECHFEDQDFLQLQNEKIPDIGNLIKNFLRNPR